MSRRTSGAAEAAAAQASEAARALQARQQELRQQGKEPEQTKLEAEPASNPEIRKIPRGNVDREKILDEIRSARGEKEPKEEPAPEPKAEAQPESTSAKAEEPPAPAQPAAAPEAPVVAEATKTVRVKVDGDEFEAPADEVEAAGGVAAYQRDKAAEKRLKAANDALAEARRTQAAVAEMLQKQQTPAQPTESDAQFIAKKMDTIRFGTPEEAAQALDEIIARKTPKIDQNAIITQAQDHSDHMASVREFDRKNADLVTNPVILKAIISLREERLAQHRRESPQQRIDWAKFYDTIAHEVRGAFGRHHQPAAQPPAPTGGTTSPVSAKEERKASITTLPTAAARATPPAEEKPETREESIRRMKKARGLLVD